MKAKELIKEARLKSPETETDEQTIIRACAVCVKEISLPDPEEEKDDRDLFDAMSRLNLRQRRALHRKMAKEKSKEDGDDDTENDDEDDKEVDEEGHRPQGSLDALAEEDEVDDNDTYPDYGDDEDDPFLKAIGGADKLLTGVAYQQKLLQQQKEHQ